MLSDRVVARPAAGNDLRISIASSLREVAPGDWARIAGRGGVYSSHPWLAALEGQPGFDARYLLVRTPAGGLVGALPVYRVEGPGSVSLYDHYALFVEPTAAGVDLRGAWFPAFYAGTKAGYRGELLIDPRLDEATAGRVLTGLLWRLAAAADESGARSLALLYLTETAAAAVLPLLGPSVRPLLSAAATHVAVRWRSFEEYVAWLPAHRRYSVRGEIRRFAQGGHQVSVGRLSDCYEEAGPLLANVQRKYGHGSTPDEMTQQLARQCAALDEQSVVFQLRHGARLVGYALCFVWADELYLRTVGFDYIATGANAEYFMLGCYLPIRYAIEHSLRVVHLGTGSYEAKLRRGAVPTPLWSALVPGRPQPAWEDGLEGWNAAALRRLRPQFGGLREPLAAERWLGLKMGGGPA
jgi:uncharacterized protein